jgi:hypothetical protein
MTRKPAPQDPPSTTPTLDEVEALAQLLAEHCKRDCYGGVSASDWAQDPRIRAARLLRELARDRERFLDELSYMVSQHCYSSDDPGVYDSGALTANIDAFEVLVESGRAKWVGEVAGRRGFIRMEVE